MNIKNTNDSEFEQLLKDNDKVIVKFYASWCGSCRLIAPKYKKLAEEEAYKDVLFLEVDAEHNPIIRGLAKVNNLPFFASFKEGSLVEGFPSSKIESIEEMIKTL